MYTSASVKAFPSSHRSPMVESFSLGEVGIGKASSGVCLPLRS